MISFSTILRGPKMYTFMNVFRALVDQSLYKCKKAFIVRVCVHLYSVFIKYYGTIHDMLE